MSVSEGCYFFLIYESFFEMINSSVCINVVFVYKTLSNGSVEKYTIIIKKSNNLYINLRR